MSAFILRDAKGHEYPISGLFQIGRSSTCHIILNNPSVSRTHATLWVQHGILYIRDERSHNGTLVNGARIAPAQPTPLHISDQVRVGDVTFSVTKVHAAAIPPPEQYAPAAQPGPSKTSPILYALIAGGFYLIIALLVTGIVVATRDSAVPPTSFAPTPLPGTLPSIIAQATSVPLQTPLSTIVPGTLLPPAGKIGVLAIAVGTDPSSPSLRAYVGNPRTDPFVLPDGTFYIEAVDQDDYAISLGKIAIASPNNAVVFPPSFQNANGSKDVQRARALKTMANSLAQIELTQLVALEGASDEFKKTMFDPTARTTQTHLDHVYAQYAVLLSQQNDLLAALDDIESRATATLPVQIASTNHKPVRGVFGSIKDKLIGFFGYAGDAGKRARDRIIQTSTQLGPEDKEDAFHSIRPDFRGGAKNYDELIEKLKSDSLNTQATQIESDLRNAPGYGAAAQKNNQTVGQIVRQEGAELVVRGGELQAQIIKTVLADVFPDIKDGFAQADKIKDWIDQVAETYKDPIGTLGQKAEETVKEDIKNRIKNNLANCCGQIPDNIRDKIANALSDKAVKGASNAIKTQLQPGTLTPRAAKSVTSIAQAPLTPATLLIRTATPTGTPTGTPTPSSTPTNTPTPTTTPDTSWIDPYVQGIANQLILQLGNPIQVAIVTEDYRQCLYNAVKNGANQSSAKAQCMNVLLALPTPTLSPTPTLTTPSQPQPSPPTACPGPPVIASFTADPSTIIAGQSSMLSWGAVTNATAAYLDGEGIATPGSTTVNPATTKTYTLNATGCGGTTKKQVTITVNPAPAPPQPPPAASVYGVFLLTNVSGGSVWVGQEADLKTRYACNFAGGGRCKGDGTDGKVQYQKKLGDFKTYEEARKAYCNALQSKPYPMALTNGYKAKIFGGDYWVDTAPSCP